MQREKRIHQGRVASLQQSRHVAFGRKAVTTKVTELAKSAIQVTYYLETFQDTRAKRERMMTVREESENNNEKDSSRGWVASMQQSRPSALLPASLITGPFLKI